MFEPEHVHWHLTPGDQARTDTSRKLRNHIRQIQALGFNVTITQAA